jgi:hypothetical protein
MGPVKGQVAASTVRFRFEMEFEGATVFYSFEGEAEPARMAGSVALGCGTAKSHGPLNQRQHGTGNWQARRLA